MSLAPEKPTRFRMRFVLALKWYNELSGSGTTKEAAVFVAAKAV
jgi:hypothetical protein